MTKQQSIVTGSILASIVFLYFTRLLWPIIGLCLTTTALLALLASFYLGFKLYQAQKQRADNPILFNETLLRLIGAASAVLFTFVLLALIPTPIRTDSVRPDISAMQLPIVRGETQLLSPNEHPKPDLLEASQLLELKSRIEQLEQRVSAPTPSAKTEIFGEVLTREFKVVDANGAVRCQIGVNQENAIELTMFTADGRIGVALGSSDLSNGIVVNGWNGQGVDSSTISIAQLRKIGPSIAIANTDGSFAFVAAANNDSTNLGLASSRSGRQSQVELRVGADGDATIQVLDTNHVGRALMAVNPKNQPAIGLSDRQGIGRISFQMDAKDIPQMALHGNTGQMRAVLGMAASNDVALFLLDADGKPTNTLK